MAKPINWSGDYPAVTTQFNADNSVNLAATQQSIERLLKAGVHGLIMLGTCGENCSLLPEENEDRVAAFLARNPGFRRLEAAAVWEGVIPGLGQDFRASPATTGTDGFYCALLGRQGG